jgi:hypothetical protein
MKTQALLIIFILFGLNINGQNNNPINPQPDDNLPVGTVIISLLHFSAFARQVHDINAANWTVHSKWAPADGRNVVGSLYESLTGQVLLPDLRGMFLRGLNQFDGVNKRSDGREDKDGDNRRAGDFQINNTKLDNIYRTNVQAFYGTNSSPYGLQSGGGGPVPGPMLGAEETRPNNVAVYYYIKIN